MNNLILNDLPLEVTYGPKKGRGSFKMKFGDCCVSVKDENGDKIGNVDGCMGGGVEFCLEEDGRIFYLSPQNLWNSFVVALNREELSFKLFKKEE